MSDVIKIDPNPTLDNVKYARPVDRFIVGLDIGKSVDSTAICVLHHKITPLLQFSNDWKRGISKQLTEERFHVVHLERLPLGTSYPAQIHAVKSLMTRPPLGESTLLVIDQTGCGAPVADMFQTSGLKLKRVSITSGNEITQHSGNCWNVPKSTLISNLEARIHSGELKVAAALTEAGPFREELLLFERHVSDAGRATWGARTGKHDDLCSR